MVLALLLSFQTWLSRSVTVGHRRRKYRDYCYNTDSPTVSHFHSKHGKLRRRTKMSIAKILLILLVCGIFLPFLYIALLDPPTTLKLIKDRTFNIPKRK